MPNKPNIKALILDVDGVLVGSQPDYNWPNPHPLVIQTLKQIRKQGIFVSLCTGKGTFAIKNIVQKAHLDNVHIGDGGAVVVDVINHQVITQHLLDKHDVQRLISFFQNLNTYVEIYTLDGYFIQKDQTCHITDKHTGILYQPPEIVDSLSRSAQNLDVVKVMPVALDLEDKQRLIKSFVKEFKHLPFQWGNHPTAAPMQFGIVTAPNISKQHAAETISQTIRVPFSQILGVGDGLTDWEFIKLCRYAGVMGNASDELKQIVAKNKPDQFFIGQPVNENGVLSIFSHFALTD